MAVTTTASLVEYTSNGSATAYSVPFPYLDDDHLRVSKISPADAETVLTLGSDYTVSAPGDTGTVTLSAAVTSGWTVRIMRVVPLTQPVEFRAQGPFSPDTWETGLDRLEMQVQQLNDGTLVASSYIYDHGDQPGGTLHAAVTSSTNGFATPAMLAAVNGLTTTYKPIGWFPTYAEVTSKPTTIEGFGLTSGTFSGNVTVGGNLNITGTGIMRVPGGMDVGIAAAQADRSQIYDISGTLYFGDKVTADTSLATLKSPPWSSISSKPTTLAGFGITDAASDAELAGVVSLTDDLDLRVTALEGVSTPTILRGSYLYNGGTTSWNGAAVSGLSPTASRPAAGQAKVTHSIGHTNYVVSVAPQVEGGVPLVVGFLKASGDVTVYMTDNAGAAVDGDFDLVITY